MQQRKASLPSELQAAADKPDWQQIQPLQELANLYLSQDRQAEARPYLQQAVAISPQPYLVQQIAQIYQRLGKTAEADQLWKQALADAAGKGLQSAEYLQVVSQYANNLAMDKRGDAARALLDEALAGTSDEIQQMQLLFARANVERIQGSPETADSFQSRAQEISLRLNPQQSNGNPVGPLFEQAQKALQAGKVNQAYEFALHAIARSAHAMDRESIGYHVSSLASNMAYKQAEDKADQLFLTALQEFESWKETTVQPLRAAGQAYVNYLMDRQRWDEARKALERFQDLMLDTRGPESGAMLEVLNMRIALEERRGAPDQALPVARQLVALVDSLTGPIGDPMTNALLTLARTEAAAGDNPASLATHWRAVAVADRSVGPADARRAQPRVVAPQRDC